MSVFIIAEAGVNHNGSIELARKLIDYNPLGLFDDGLKENIDWFNNNWDKIRETADFPIGMSSAVRK